MNKNFELSTELVDENFGQDSICNLNSDKLRKKLDWSDLVSFDSGIDNTLKWINENWNDIKNDSTEYKHKI